ncbi:MAG: sugar ABC transporter permease, partial [Merismopediaceae bacterium]|nr:sugar ABC transporter permease [Merismopediaceae bacterium]
MQTRWSSNWFRQLTPYLFLLPALVILGIAVFYPAFQAFSLSFTQYDLDLTQTPQWVGLKNFQRLLQ